MEIQKVDPTDLNEYLFDLNGILLKRIRCGEGPDDIIQNYSAYVLLAGCDFCHDFDDNGGRVDADTWGDGYDPRVGKTDNFAYLIRKALNGAIPVSDPTNDEFTNFTKKWLREAPTRLLKPTPSISSSGVEDQTIRFFETHYRDELKVDYTTVITYRDIINRINALKTTPESINQAIYRCGEQLYGDYGQTCCLDLDLAENEDWDRDYSTENKIHIALFLLNYFFPPADGDVDENTKFLSYMTFDADSNIPSKIFGLLDQVINLVTPLNISDSATGEAHLVSKKNKRYGSKNCYKFPTNASKGGKLLYMYTGNVFTEDKGRFYIDKGEEEYGEANRYNFNVSFEKCGPPQSIATIPFNSEFKSGPSVNYLSNLANNNGYGYPGKKMADLTEFVNGRDGRDERGRSVKIGGISGMFRGRDQKEIISQILFDIKRCGDWEQCNAAFFLEKEMDRVILCSLDRLCSLYSRCIGNRTIWHHGPHLKLYRFPKNITPEQLALMASDANKRKLRIFINKIRVLNNFYIKNVGKYNAIPSENIGHSFVLPVKKPNDRYQISYTMCNNIAKIIIKIIHLKLDGLFQNIDRVLLTEPLTSISGLVDTLFQAESLPDPNERDNQIKQIIEQFIDRLSDESLERLITVSTPPINEFIDDAIFKYMSELCGDTINEKNILIFDSNYTKFVTMIGSDPISTKLPKSSIFLYNGTDICNLYELLFEIEIFEGDKVRTQSILIKNYSESLINRKFFELLKDVKRILSFVTPDHEVESAKQPVFELIDGSIGLNYDKVLIGIEDTRKNRNIEYYNGLKRILIGLSEALGIIQVEDLDGGGIDPGERPSKGKGKKSTKKAWTTTTTLPAKRPTSAHKPHVVKIDELTTSQINNILNNLESLTDRFMILSSELYRHRISGVAGMDDIMEEFEYFCDDALLLFKNSYTLLYELKQDDEKRIRVNIFPKWTELTKSYTSICLFFYILINYVRYPYFAEYINQINTSGYEVGSDIHDFTSRLFELIKGEEFPGSNGFKIPDSDRFKINDYLTILNQDDADGTLIVMIHGIVQNIQNYGRNFRSVIDFIFGTFFGIESLFRLVTYKWSIGVAKDHETFETNQNAFGYTEIGNVNMLNSVVANERLFKRGLGLDVLGSENEANRKIFVKVGPLLSNIMLLELNPDGFVTHVNAIFEISGGGSNKKRGGTIKLRRTNIKSKKANPRKIRVTKINRNKPRNKTSKLRNK